MDSENSRPFIPSSSNSILHDGYHASSSCCHVVAPTISSPFERRALDFFRRCSLCGRVYEYENVVQDVPLLGPRLVFDLESLAEAHWLLLTFYLERAGDHDHDPIFGGRLSVEGIGSVYHLLERKVHELLDNGRHSPHRLPLECEHGVVAVDIFEEDSVLIERPVV